MNLLVVTKKLNKWVAFYNNLNELKTNFWKKFKVAQNTDFLNIKLILRNYYINKINSILQAFNDLPNVQRYFKYSYKCHRYLLKSFKKFHEFPRCPNALKCSFEEKLLTESFPPCQIAQIKYSNSGSTSNLNITSVESSEFVASSNCLF